MEISPDGRMLAAIGGFEGVIVWDLHSGKVRRFIGNKESSAYTRIGFNGPNHLAAVSDDGDYFEWNPTTGRRLVSGSVDTNRVLAFCPISHRILGRTSVWSCWPYTNMLEVWEYPTRKRLWKGMIAGGPISIMAFGSRGRMIAAGDDRGRVLLINFEAHRLKGLQRERYCRKNRSACVARSERTRVLGSHKGQVTSLVMGPQGRLLASASCTGGIKVWDVRSGRGLFELRGRWSNVGHLAFEPQGRVLVSSHSDRLLRFWGMENGALIRRVRSGVCSPEMRIAFGGKMLVTYSDNLPTLRVFWKDVHLADILVWGDGSWVIFTPEGYLDGSRIGRRRLALLREIVRDGSVSGIPNRCYVPGLLARLLRKDTSFRHIQKCPRIGVCGDSGDRQGRCPIVDCSTGCSQEN